MPLTLLELTDVLAAHPAGTAQARQTLAMESKSSYQLIANVTCHHITTFSHAGVEPQKKVLVSDISDGQHRNSEVPEHRAENKCLLSKGHLGLFTV